MGTRKTQRKSSEEQRYRLGSRDFYIFVGSFLAIVGGYQFGVDTGLFDATLPFYAIVLIVFGVAALVKGFSQSERL